MSVDWSHFTPWSSLAGGLMVGLSAALFLLVLGRIAGISGLIARPLLAIFTGKAGAPERVSIAFILGLIGASWPWRLWADLPTVTVTADTRSLVVAGLLVGVGVRMGQGCTSGHGVCGLSRWSLRSLVNVAAFMSAGMLTVYLIKRL
jgi:hypothetical protein